MYICSGKCRTFPSAVLTRPWESQLVGACRFAMQQAHNESTGNGIGNAQQVSRSGILRLSGQSLFGPAVPAVPVAIPIRQNMNRFGHCREHSPMGRFIMFLEDEWVPVTGYTGFSYAARVVAGRIVGYYSALRPHVCDGGVPPDGLAKRHGKNL